MSLSISAALRQCPVRSNICELLMGLLFSIISDCNSLGLFIIYLFVRFQLTCSYFHTFPPSLHYIFRLIFFHLHLFPYFLNLCGHKIVFNIHLFFLTTCDHYPLKCKISITNQLLKITLYLVFAFFLIFVENNIRRVILLIVIICLVFFCCIFFDRAGLLYLFHLACRFFIGSLVLSEERVE